jgi:hypothetical protein
MWEPLYTIPARPKIQPHKVPLPPVLLVDHDRRGPSTDGAVNTLDGGPGNDACERGGRKDVLVNCERELSPYSTFAATKHHQTHYTSTA